MYTMSYIPGILYYIMSTILRPYKSLWLQDRKALEPLQSVLQLGLRLRARGASERLEVYGT